MRSVVDAARVFDQHIDRMRAGANRGLHGNLLETPIDGADQFLIDIDRSVVSHLTKIELSGNGAIDLRAIKDVTVILAEVLHRLWLI